MAPVSSPAVTVQPALPPGPRLPISVQTLRWVTRPLPFLDSCSERFGDIFTLRLRNAGTLVFLSDPSDIKRVFTGDPALLKAGEANIVLRPVMGRRSVLLLDEPAHMQHRKLMLPHFHGERMQRYCELMTEVASAEVRSWPVNTPFALWPRMQQITLEVIMRAVFGITQRQRREHVRDLVKHAIAWFTKRRRLALVAALGPAKIEADARFQAVLGPLDRVLYEEIALRRKAPDLEARQDILSMLILSRYEDGAPMDDTDLRDELLTLLLAGHETTATSLAWMFERLMRHPEKLARLREEIVNGAGREEYLDAVIKETLRLRPVIPIVLRKLAEPIELRGYKIPAGAALAPCIHLVHRRQDIYPQPTMFLPERFLERNASTYAWIPFGGGVRRCLGASFAQLEMKQVAKAVLCAVQLRAVHQRSERVVRRSITLAPSKQAEAIVVRRIQRRGELAGVMRSGRDADGIRADGSPKRTKAGSTSDTMLAQARH